MREDEPFTLLQTAGGLLPLIVEPFIYCKLKKTKKKQKHNIESHTD